ncbi:MAG: aminotransferase class I/II-fold pyridoxal phosphate-dependent enzyme, partial [Brachybacterium sp.]|nr:aminotransferase class I/II-fold pyridoxal phosphate-dependent enzyme [Brachybacterium sp.]
QGIAGLRLGWAVAHPRLARALAQVTLPFGASSIAQAAGLATLTADARAELDHRATHIRTERARVQQALAAQGWELPDTQGNFVYFPLGVDTGTFTDFCWDRGLVVRGYVGDGVRITIAETEANDLTIAVAGEWLTR